MVASSDFLAFATGGSANVESQASWASDSVVANGFTAGIAQSSQVNKALRQASFIGAGLAKLVANQLSINVADDGDLPGFVTDLTNALAALAAGSVSLTGYLLSSTAASTYVPLTRTVSTAGLATGGGALSSNQTITVPKAAASDIRSANDTKATTGLGVSTVIQDGSLLYAAASGSANALTASLAPAPAGLTTGMNVVIKATATNTDAATLNLNGSGAKAITAGGNPLSGGMLLNGQLYSLIYDGTNWQLQSPTMTGIVAYSLGVNGWELYSHGKLEQWGTLAIGSGTNVITTGLIFPIPFPNAIWNITGNADGYANPGWTAVTVTFSSRDNNGCSVVCDTANSGQTFWPGRSVNWRAIGN